jgi:Methyltransferase small domain
MNNSGRHCSAASLAGEAILLEIGDSYGVIDTIRRSNTFTPDDLAKISKLPISVMKSYVEALESAGLLVGVGNGALAFTRSDHFDEAIHDVGYVAWGLRACDPLIKHASDFAANFTESVANYPRDGGLIARTSKWMGEESFYPHAERAILGLRPKKIVDLGAGAAGLLIRCLKQLPETRAVAIDMSATACEAAQAAVRVAGMSDRISIVNNKLQDLAVDSTCLQGADVFHAGFVLHDLVSNNEDALPGVLQACRRANTDSTLLVVDGLPYVRNLPERAFSAAFTFLHRSFMGRVILSEQQWTESLTKAGFGRIDITPLGIPGGRLFAAHTT